MALDRHRPAPRLTGMDLTDMSPDLPYFEHHELEGDWPFTTKQAFHLIHAQSLGGVITDYDRFYANAFRHLLPGGARLLALREWEALIHEAAAKFDKRINVAAEQKELMHSAGLVQVDEQIFKVPFGKWSDDPILKRIGSFYVYQMQCALEGYTLRLFTKTLGWSKEDTDALINRVQEELQQKDLRLYSYFYLVIGQKPAQAARKQ
ncbi:uncharacterized protein N7518_006960 [Penicillium psychrosexuale]|uniref:uncharacterized protein n=1 Tax=Penicillium psychrosexuale TaxID=1002107 RepID=UPI0025456F84|nr:uncharacterized protein N7518_006960 [Penicillium psychrosexuale]KAJ5789949.1 hypothetical protein N7518_006960 [Penicillium psychrosexuale]